MGTIPTLDNKSLDILNEVIRAIMQGGELAAEAYIDTLAPGLLATPVVGWLIEEGITYLAQSISIVGQRFADSIVLDLQTNGEKSNVVNAGTAFQIALASGDPVAIGNAEQSLRAAYSSLIHWDGSGTIN